MKEVNIAHENFWKEGFLLKTISFCFSSVKNWNFQINSTSVHFFFHFILFYFGSPVEGNVDPYKQNQYLVEDREIKISEATALYL